MTLKSILRSLFYLGPEICAACGHPSRIVRSAAISPQLSAQWRLSPEQSTKFDAREGHTCAYCQSNLRSRQFASVVTRELNRLSGGRSRSLAAAVRARGARSLKVAEINGAGSLHPFLAQLPGLAYSEYGSNDPEVRSESLTGLSYADESFDLVLTSDTLEHVPEVDRALEETLRILKPGGAHLFTVPMLFDRPTRARARVENGVVTHLLPPSYHGDSALQKDDLLVFNEFGTDFADRVCAAGFEVEIVRDRDNDALATFVARKPS